MFSGIYIEYAKFTHNVLVLLKFRRIIKNNISKFYRKFLVEILFIMLIFLFEFIQFKYVSI